MKRNRSSPALAALLVLSGGFANGQPPATAAAKPPPAVLAAAPPETLGLSPQRLARMREAMRAFVDKGPVGEAYRKEGVTDGLAFPEVGPAENVARLARAPLISPPGQEYHYGLSTDVLGRLVEVVSGRPLDVFFRERIFAPLGMSDTSFTVTEAKWPRLAAVYAPADGGGLRPMKDPETFDLVVMSPWEYYRPAKKYLSGGAGLVSTARSMVYQALVR